MAGGFGPEYAACEMERTIQRLIVQPLGKALPEGRFRDRDEIAVSVSVGVNYIELIAALYYVFTKRKH
jgi:hypothetical protein